LRKKKGFTLVQWNGSEAGETKRSKAVLQLKSLTNQLGFACPFQVECAFQCVVLIASRVCIILSTWFIQLIPITMPTRIHDLIIKQLKGKLSPEEHIELEDFKTRSPEHKEMVENLSDPSYLLEMIPVYRAINVNAAWKRYKGEP